ncbi:hypothetical protein Chor_005268 [Crotalus horridus]
MEAPVCLVENRPDGLRVSPEALRLLSDIRNPVVVVSIVGLYRTGKSYLMNRLAGKTPGFSLGSTVQAKTKGIWMWCLPYPERPHQTLVLLDTEGLGDIQKGNPQTDDWIFALAVWANSFVTELSEHIKAKASSAPGDASEFVRFFPTFIWTLRDVLLQLEWDGQPITEDEYLEHALELKKGNTKENEILNLPHKCIRLFFPKRKCFVFECPAKRKKLPHLEQMKDMLAKLVKDYVDTICRGEVPCLENTVLALAEIENRAALQEAVVRYAELMEQNLQLPTENLQKTLESKKKEYCSKNELKSSEICSALLNSLSENLEKNFKNGSYSRAGGHQEFLNDLENVEKLFLETPKKGIMAGKFLREFLQGKEAIRKTILKSDLSLQKKEKEIEDEKMKAKARELEQKVQKQEMEMSKEKEEDQKHSYEMNLQKLKEKMEQQAFLKEGFEQEVSQLKEEIQKLKKENEAVEEPTASLPPPPPRARMEAPVCLVENRKNRLRVSSEGLQLLSDIRNPVVVVSIVGLYRTGKSYLMNKLAGKNSGFCLGSTVQAKTKGIWMCWANSFVTELSQYIKSKASSAPGDTDDSSEFVGFFPMFIWTVRDFSLQLERDGQSITEDEYLEHALELKIGNSQKKQTFNMPRKYIRLFFHTRKCFVFDSPTKSRNLRYLENMVDTQLEPEFVEQAKKFLLAKLVETYVDTISSGNIPCLENTVLALAEIENRAALQEAVARYTQLMDHSLQLPTDSLQELLDKHKICEEQALQMFMARAFKDDTREFQVELMKTLDSKKEEYCKKNKEKSSEICSALLASLSEGLEQNIKNGSYSRAGGHQEFLNDLQKVEKQFFDTPKKGIMVQNDEAWKILKKFLRGKEDISKAILQNDKALQMNEKEIAGKGVNKLSDDAGVLMKAKAKELEKEVQKLEKEMSKQKSADHKQSQDMNFHMLKKKRLEEKKQRLEEYEKMIESKLREQKALLEEGFEKEASQLNEEIEELRKKKEEVEKPSWISSALENLKTAIREKLSKIHEEVVEPVVDRFKTLIQNRSSKD